MTVLLTLLLPGCGPLLGGPDASADGVWVAELGIPEQRLDAALLGVTDRDAWLAARPRIVLGAGFASIAVLFTAGDAPEELVLEGLFEHRDEIIVARTNESGSTSGLDHNLSWSVEINDDETQHLRTWVAVDLVGDPGCGGDTQPRTMSAFDADRMPIPLDEERMGVGGIQIAFVVPDHDCIRAD